MFSDGCIECGIIHNGDELDLYLPESVEGCEHETLKIIADTINPMDYKNLSVYTTEYNSKMLSAYSAIEKTKKRSETPDLKKMGISAGILSFLTWGLYGTLYSLAERAGSGNPSVIAAVGTGTYLTGIATAFITSRRFRDRCKDPCEDMKNLDRAFIKPFIIEQESGVF